MKILFVDDMPDTRMLFSIAFERQGHLTRAAADGMEAVEAVRGEPFDAIVMDVEMPRMNGWDATRHIRQMPNGQNVPILIFTGYGEDQRKALEVGANATPRERLFRKPVNRTYPLFHAGRKSADARSRERCCPGSLLCLDHYRKEASKYFEV
jgi:CheY-like chemotaxis protein